MTASTRWLLGRIVPVLGIAGLMLCLDGAVVLILAYEEGGNNQGLPPPCDRQRASTALAPCHDDHVSLCEDKPQGLCPRASGALFVQGYRWPRDCISTEDQTLCEGDLEPCYKVCQCVWVPNPGVCKPNPDL